MPRFTTRRHGSGNTTDWVLCDPTVRSRDTAAFPEITLQGWSARGEGGLRLQRHFRHGSFAKRMLVPTENAKPIGSIAPAEAARWCELGTLLITYGGWLAARLQPGETVLFNGATGNFGSAAVAVAIAMGAACVVAPGRNRAILDDLARRFSPRVRTVGLSGEEAADRERMRQAAPAEIDCVLDQLSPSAPATAARAAIMAVRFCGRVVLMGGVGMLDGTGLDLPYPWIMRNCICIIGQWMYPPEATTRLAALVRAGLLSLDQFNAVEFPLNQANAAVAHAAEHAGPFSMTVLRP